MNSEQTSDAIPHADPHAIFESWFAQAQQSEPNDPNAMALATATPDGLPSVRMVLLKGHGPDGFVFYTNFHSRKGGELAANPHVALLFHWKFLMEGVQVKIEGTVEPVSAEEADAYFASRPRGSQIGAWASLQSQPLASREQFEQRYGDYEKQYEGAPVPRPPHWSGFRVVPERIEFWYGAQFRLHERQCYERNNGVWSQVMLYP